MTTTQDKDPKATAAQPKQPTVPDGKSKLPTDLPDFPVTDTTDPGSSGGSTTTK
jgi:hypothetical protein